MGSTSFFSYRTPSGWTQDALTANIMNQGGASINRFGQVVDSNGNPVGMGGMGGMGGVGAAGFGLFGGGGGSLQDLLAKQEASNEWAKQQNMAEWAQAKGRLASVMPEYDSDVVNQQTRGLTSQLLANPEAINDQTQQQIMNRAQVTNLATQQARMQQAAMEAAERGLTGGGQLATLQDQIRQQGARQMAQTGSELDQARAVRRNQDWLSAIQTGRQVGMDRANLNQQNAATWANSLPQYQGDDYSGLAALLARQQGGFGGAGRRVTPMGGGANARGSQYTGQGIGGWNMAPAGQEFFSAASGLGANPSNVGALTGQLGPQGWNYQRSQNQANFSDGFNYAGLYGGANYAGSAYGMSPLYGDQTKKYSYQPGYQYGVY